MSETPLARLAAIVSSRPQCTLITSGADGFAHARTITRLNPLEEGRLDFATDRRERKVRELEGDPRVTVFFVDPETRDTASIFGTAEVLDDPALKALRWREEFRRYWPAGPGDANLVVIRVRPESGEYLVAEPEIKGSVRFE